MSTTVETVRELHGDSWRGQAVLVKRADEYFVVSSVTPIVGGPETLVFSADANGEVDSYLQVAGGRGVSRAEAIAELAEQSA